MKRRNSCTNHYHPTDSHSQRERSRVLLLAPGIYTLRLQVDAATVAKRVVLQ